MGSLTPEDSLPTGILAHFDVDLQRFYLEALNKELDVQNKHNACNIKKALKEVVEAYKKQSPTDHPKSIRFDTPFKRCAYVLKHGPCFTAAVSAHFLRLVRTRGRLFRDAMLRGEARICCLGGGPASDAVGVCKVLSALYRQLRSGCRQPLRVRVTVVDANGDWATTAGNVLELLEEKPGLIGIDGVELSLDFLAADLTLPIGDRVRKAIGDADIVTMVYFLSAVNGGKDRIESRRMVEEIMKCTRAGSVLFFLDSAMDLHYRQMDFAAESLGNMAQIYDPSLEEFHTLSLASVRRFLELYKRNFGKFLCLTNCFVSCCAWQRVLETDRRMYDKMGDCVCISLTLSPGNRLEDQSEIVLVDTSKDQTTESLPSMLDKSLLDDSQLGNSEVETMDERFDKTDDCTCKSHVLSMDKSPMDNFEVVLGPPDCKLRREWLPNKVGKCDCRLLLDNSRLDRSEALLVGRLLMDTCAQLVQEESLLWRKSQQKAVSRLTDQMVKFRSQIGRLLAAEFEQGDVENDVFDDLEAPPDDAFDNLLTEYCRSVPEYFFQTKSKKKRIFTGLPVSI